MVKSRRGSLKSSSSSLLSPLQQHQHQQSGSLVSAVLDSASSASPRIFPLDPGSSSVELPEHNRNTDNSVLNNRHSATSGSPRNTHNQQQRHNHKNGSAAAAKRNELSKRIIPTAPPYPPLVHYAPVTAPLGKRASGNHVAVPTSASSAEKERQAQIVPESNGIGRRLLNGFYDEFLDLDGLPFRRQSATTYCDPPAARRYSLMGRAGTARNSEFKRNPITQHRQR